MFTYEKRYSWAMNRFGLPLFFWHVCSSCLSYRISGQRSCGGKILRQKFRCICSGSKILPPINIPAWRSYTRILPPKFCRFEKKGKIKSSLTKLTLKIISTIKWQNWAINWIFKAISKLSVSFAEDIFAIKYCIYWPIFREEIPTQRNLIFLHEIIKFWRFWKYHCGDDCKISNLI